MVDIYCMLRTWSVIGDIVFACSSFRSGVSEGSKEEKSSISQGATTTKSVDMLTMTPSRTCEHNSQD